MKFLKEHSLFLLLFSVCVVLRLVPLFDYQYTLDELSGLGRTQFTNFSDLIEFGVKTTDTHPALVQIVIFYMSQLFGYANWVIKLPFLLCGFGAIIYAYRFCLHNFSKQAGIFATVILSFSLIFVFYAPIARMYVSGLFLSMAMLYYFFEIFFLKELKISNFFYLGLFALLSALNQHLNALFAFTLCAAGLLFLNKGNIKHYLITCAVVVVCYLPHLPVTLFQLQMGGIGFDQGGWLPKPEWDAGFSFFKVLLGTGKAYLVFLALLVLSVALNKKLAFTKKQVFLLCLFLANYFIIYFYSLYRAPVFQNSVMLFSSVALVIFLSSLLDFKKQPVFYAAVGILSAVMLYKSYVKKDYYAQCVKTIFEYQYERTAQYKQTLGDNMVYPVFFDADTFMQKIYFEKYRTHFDYTITGDSMLSSTKLFSQLVAGLKCDYVILASSAPAHQALVAQYFPFLIENTQTQALNFKVYSKREADRIKVVEDDKVLKVSTVNKPGDFNYTKLQPGMLTSGKLLVKPDSSIEYPFDAIAKYNNVVQSEGQELLLKATFKLAHPGNNHLTTYIAVNDVGNNTSYMYGSKEAGDYSIAPDSTVTVYADNFFGTAHHNAKINSNINCFIWNRDKEPFEMTNFEIKVIDYWPQKWNYWK